VALAGAGERPAPRRAAWRHRRAPDGWTITTVALAALIAAPLLSLPLSFAFGRTDALARFSNLLPDAAVATLWLVLGVGAGTVALGTALAGLVAFCEFPGRRWMEWALALPLAMPGYVFTLFALGTAGTALPQIRSTGGAIVIFTLVLYPYVYLLARGAFLAQSRSLFEAARSLGSPPAAALVRIAAPLARPAILGGAALAVMEALADFGTVNLLGVHTFTDAIYRVWFNAFDRQAAMQLGALLMSVTLTLLVLERALRGRARYTQDIARGGPLPRRGGPLPRRRLTGPAALAASALPLAVIGVVVAAPVGQLAAWSLDGLGEDALGPGFATAARNSVLFALLAALVVTGAATTLAYGLRAARSRVGAAAVRVATIGYGLPGSVVAAAVIVPMTWLDRRVGDAGDVLGLDVGLLLTGTALGLIAAYLVRFAALAFQSVDAGLERIPPNLDEAARGLGADRVDVLARVHLPLLRTGLITAALLVFSETIKELPATMLLRPVGSDTLAIEVWRATAESLWATAALPALLIVLVGLVPIALLIRASAGAPSATPPGPP
jgi:iron(III) transport system permease protein